MSLVKIVIAILIAIVVFLGFRKFRVSPRDRRINKAVKSIFEIKRRHHDLIVEALENGASTGEHESLLKDKEIEVLEAMDRVEKRLNIVIDKEGPTVPGPVVVLDRRDIPRN